VPGIVDGQSWFAADAEDATQEIFPEIWKSASRYDASVGSEAVFLTTIARRRLIVGRRDIEKEKCDALTGVVKDACISTADATLAASELAAISTRDAALVAAEFHE
jgi:RNA polymerase sigma-70 factor, ECF subfamily